MLISYSFSSSFSSYHKFFLNFNLNNCLDSIRKIEHHIFPLRILKSLPVFHIKNKKKSHHTRLNSQDLRVNLRTLLKCCLSCSHGPLLAQEDRRTQPVALTSHVKPVLEVTEKHCPVISQPFRMSTLTANIEPVCKANISIFHYLSIPVDLGEFILQRKHNFSFFN